MDQNLVDESNEGDVKNWYEEKVKAKVKGLWKENIRLSIWDLLGTNPDDFWQSLKSVDRHLENDLVKIRSRQ